MVSRLAIFVVFFLFYVCSYGQRYNVLGEFDKHPSQSMSIYKDEAFLFNSDGYYRIFDLKKKTITKSSRLESGKFNNHCNSASFSSCKRKQQKYPLLYLSECRPGSFRCFVEQIDSSSTLLQTISALIDGEQLDALDWIAEKKFLYAISRKDLTKGKAADAEVSIWKFKKPKIEEGKIVTLTEEDLLERFSVRFPSLIQDALIRKNYLYIVCGEYDGCTRYLPEWVSREINIIDLKKHKLTKKIDISKIVKDAPEGCAFYHNKFLLYCGQRGGLWEINVE